MDERKKELMNDLDSYLANRLKNRSSDDDSFYSFKKKKVEVLSSDDLPPEENLVEEYEAQGPGFWKSLWASIVGESANSEDQVEGLKEEVVEVKQEESHVKADLKDLAQISLEMLRNTSKDWVKDFRETQDFVKFKEILRRHEVIK